MHRTLSVPIVRSAALALALGAPLASCQRPADVAPSGTATADGSAGAVAAETHATPDPHVAPDTDYVATFGDVGVSSADVARTIGWVELKANQRSYEEFGDDWLNEDGFLERMTRLALGTALLRDDADRWGITLSADEVRAARMADPTLAVLASRPDRDTILGLHGLTWDDLLLLADVIPLKDRWTTYRIEALSEEDYRHAWDAVNNRAELAIVDVPNVFTREAVDQLLEEDAGAVDAWITARQHMMPDGSGELDMDALRRRGAQSVLAARRSAPAAQLLAQQVHAAMIAGEGLDALLEANALEQLETPSFRRVPNGSIPVVGEAPELSAQVFDADTEVGDVLGPVRTRSGIVVAKVLARDLPTDARYAEARDTHREGFRAYMEANAWQARISEVETATPAEIDLERLRRELSVWDARRRAVVWEGSGD